MPDYKILMNESWIRALAEESPSCKNNVENGCYW